MTEPVVGLDSVSPVYNPDGIWQWWEINTVWRGLEGEGKYVPKLNDYVMDASTYTTYRVSYLDPVTLIPTLVEIRPGNMNYSLSETDVLFGVGPGTPSDTYRVYIDNSVTPHVLAVDARLKIAGTQANYAKIFKGTDASLDDEIISRVYDSNGNFISENVPLELVAIDQHVNYAIKIVSVCHTVADLVDGEVVTVVAYNDQGHVVSKRQLLAENTSFIRSLNTSQKYVSHINLESPFMSATVDNIIDFPLNIPINALNIMGVVNYSDGSILKLPVNGVKFKLFGLEQYVSSIVGQNIPLVLSYSLSENETAYAGVTTDGNHITEPYNLVTINPNNSYTVKLFGYPVWVDEVNGYTMEWWLFNLDRNLYFNVTANVRFDTNTGSFNPKGYGFLQRKNVSVNLRDVSGAFKPFIHVQSVDITLISPPADNITPWTVAHSTDDSRPPYGIELFATKVSLQVVNVSSGIELYSEWLTRVYNSLYPLMDRSVELSVPVPTHLIVTYSTFELEIPVADWDQDIDTGVNINLYSSVKLRFIKRTISGDLQLGMSYLTIK